MTEKTCQQRYVALVNMVFDQEGGHYCLSSIQFK